MAITGIVAVDKNGAIGKEGKLPWHYPADLRFFKEQTAGHACVMGHLTWLTLKKPLPNRLNVVLSRRAEIEPQPSVMVLRDTLSVLSLAPYLAGDLFIIGGAQVFRAFLPHIARWIVTEIPLAVAGADTFMPENYLAGFAPRETRELAEDLRAIFYERT